MSTVESRIRHLDGRETADITVEDCLNVLPPVRREDYAAVVLDNVSPSQQAEERGVLASTVSENVARAKDQVAEYLREHGLIPRRSPGYNVEIHSIGGREPDGTPAALGKWTFETTVVREVVESAISGRVLNACAGKTHLEHHPVVRNDLNPERDADHHEDVCTLDGSTFDTATYDAVVFDPPFDNGQAEKRYEGFHAGDITAARGNLAELVAPGGILIELGWNSHSIAKGSDGWEQTDLHLFYRGPCLPDVFLTICQKTQFKFGDIR